MCITNNYTDLVSFEDIKRDMEPVESAETRLTKKAEQRQSEA